MRDKYQHLKDWRIYYSQTKASYCTRFKQCYIAFRKIFKSMTEAYLSLQFFMHSSLCINAYLCHQVNFLKLKYNFNKHENTSNHAEYVFVCHRNDSSHETYLFNLTFPEYSDCMNIFNSFVFKYIYLTQADASNVKRFQQRFNAFCQNQYNNLCF